MTQPLSVTPAAPARRRSIWAVIALVGTLVATGAAVPAYADVVGDGPGTISGTVTSTDGTPVEGAFVGANGPTSSPYTLTDASGFYELSGLDAAIYDINASAENYEYGNWQQAYLSEATPTANVDFVLVPYQVGGNSIIGQVTLDGAPVADQYVYASLVGSDQNVSTQTDADGFFSLTGLADGGWDLNAYIGDVQPLFVPTTQVSGDSTATVNIAYLSWPVGTSSISGTASDSATGDPIADVSIWIYAQGAGSAEGSTDSAGYYSFGQLPAGDYSVSLNAPGYLEVYTHAIVADDQALTLDFELVATNATISGHVAAPDGSPVADIYVNAYTAGGAYSGAQTDENGDFIIVNAGAVEYTVTVGGIGTPFATKSQQVSAVANGDVQANFTLAYRTTGYITGLVYAADGSFPHTAVCATLYSAKNKKPLGHVATFGVEFGDGTYSFDNVKPGTYTVGFKDCDDTDGIQYEKAYLGGVTNFKDATFITIAAAQDSVENNVWLEIHAN